MADQKRPGDVRGGGAYVEIYALEQLAPGLSAAMGRLRAFSRQVAAVGAGLQAASAAVIGPIVGGAVALAGIGSQVTDVGARTGMDVTAVQGLGYAAEASGASIDDVQAAVAKLNRTVAAASDGSTEAAEALAAVGLSAEQLAALRPDERFRLIAERLRRIEDPGRRSAAAIALLGKQATALMPLLAQGAAGIAALEDRARQLGLVFAPEDIARAKELSDLITDIKLQLQGLFLGLGAAALPDLIALGRGLQRALAIARQFIDRNRTLVQWLLRIAAVVAVAGVALVALAAAMYAVTLILPILSLALAAVQTAYTLAAAAATAFAVAVAAGSWPVLALVAAVTALAVALGLLVAVLGPGDILAALSGFADLARRMLDGIAQALRAGQVELAAQVLWAGLLVAWVRGFNTLISATRLMGQRLVYGMIAIWAAAQKALGVIPANAIDLMAQRMRVEIDKHLPAVDFEGQRAAEAELRRLLALAEEAKPLDLGDVDELDLDGARGGLSQARAQVQGGFYAAAFRGIPGPWDALVPLARREVQLGEELVRLVRDRGVAFS